MAVKVTSTGLCGSGLLRVADRVVPFDAGDSKLYGQVPGGQAECLRVAFGGRAAGGAPS